MTPPLPDTTYATSFEEIAWGSLLVGVTMTIHGLAMIGVIQFYNWRKEALEKSENIWRGIAMLIVSSWMIVLSSR